MSVGDLTVLELIGVSYVVVTVATYSYGLDHSVITDVLTLSEVISSYKADLNWLTSVHDGFSCHFVDRCTILLCIAAIVVIRTTVAPTAVRLTINNSITDSLSELLGN